MTAADRSKLKKKWRQEIIEIIDRLHTAENDIRREDRVDALDALSMSQLKLASLIAGIRSTFPTT
jgi:hypothetical protein